MVGTLGLQQVFLVVAATAFLATPCSAQRSRVRADCDAGETIQRQLIDLSPGDTLLVNGTCRESVTIPREKIGVTLNGQGTATIQHPGGAIATSAGRHVVYIRGQGITITGFTIRGGEDGVHLSGPASAVIQLNRILQNRGRGIHADKGSVVQIIDNIIRENGAAGIQVTENSYARIGFLIPPDNQPRPNSIEDNGGSGILVERNSGAWIVSNAIRGNRGSGIVVDRHSEADVLANTISDNRGDGIQATRESGVNLHSEGTQRREGPNRTLPNMQNDEFGVSCSIGGYVSGPLGSLTGRKGSKGIDSGCIDRITVP